MLPEEAPACRRGHRQRYLTVPAPHGHGDGIAHLMRVQHTVVIVHGRDGGAVHGQDLIPRPEPIGAGYGQDIDAGPGYAVLKGTRL